MRHLKGNFLAIAATGIAAGVIIAGLAVNVASGAPTDTTPAAPTAVTGNPPAAPIEPPSTAPSTGVGPNGNQLGVGSAPGTGAQAGSSNLPTAGFGPNATGTGVLPMALVLLGLAGFALVTAGTTLSRKQDS